MPFCFDCGAEVSGPPDHTCKRCGRQHWLNPRLCAGVLAMSGRKVLLARRAIAPWRGCWDVPGGHVENGELPEAAARREFTEETGHCADHLAWLGACRQPTNDSRYGDAVILYYIARLDHDALRWPDQFRPTPEVSALSWFDLGSLPKALAFPEHLVGLLDVMSGLEPHVCPR